MRGETVTDKRSQLANLAACFVINAASTLKNFLVEIVRINIALLLFLEVNIGLYPPLCVYSINAIHATGVALVLALDMQVLLMVMHLMLW